MMIHALDHIVLAAHDLDAAATAYETLLGRRYEGRDRDGGTARAWFHLSNLSLVVAGPTGTGPTDDCISVRLETAGEGLATIAFAVADLDKARGLAGRRGLPSAEPNPLRLPRDKSEAGTAQAASLCIDATHGVHLCLVERAISTGQQPVAANPAISGLDHVVIRSPHPDRAVALYAGRLGLDLRLDRSNPDWGSRLLFFRCGDLVVEIAHDLKAGIGDGPDELWGLSWRASDLDAAHARLATAGVAISGIRTGRRPGTRVFTIQDKAARVPTLVIGA